MTTAFFFSLQVQLTAAFLYGIALAYLEEEEEEEEEMTTNRHNESSLPSYTGFRLTNQELTILLFNIEKVVQSVNN